MSIHEVLRDDLVTVELYGLESEDQLHFEDTLMVDVNFS